MIQMIFERNRIKYFDFIHKDDVEDFKKRFIYSNKEL